MGYVIFRGIGTEGSLSVVGSGNVLSNVFVSNMPDHRKAEMRFTEYYVKGRDGALHVDEGYGNFDLTVTLVLIKATVAARQLVNAWADGTGKLVTSDDLTKCYRASVKEEVTWTRVKANGGFYDTAEVTFNCEPCMYQATETPTVLTETGSILNVGTADAFPLLALEGSGTGKIRIDSYVNNVKVAEYPIQINSMAANTPVYIDAENGYVYTDAGAVTMTGEIPMFPVGSNNVVNFIQNVTKVTITPHWRWV